MKYLYTILAFFFFSCQSRQEKLFEKFENLVEKVSHLDKRIQEISKAPKGFSYVATEISSSYHEVIVPQMDFVYEVISIEDLSDSQYQGVLELMNLLEELILKMEKILNLSQQKKTIIAMVFVFACKEGLLR